MLALFRMFVVIVTVKFGNTYFFGHKILSFVSCYVLVQQVGKTLHQSDVSATDYMMKTDVYQVAEADELRNEVERWAKILSVEYQNYKNLNKQ